MPDAVSSSPIRGKARDRRMRENCLSGSNGGLVPGDRAFYSLLVNGDRLCSDSCPPQPLGVCSMKNNLQHDILAFTTGNRPHFEKVRIPGMEKIRIQEDLEL
jgi:hypothetical protein